MYTEENEFDYNEYLKEGEPENGGNSPFNKRLIIRIILIILCLILVIFVVFKIRNLHTNKENDDKNVVDSSVVFNNNLTLLKETAETYFFEKENYPKEVGEIVKVSVNDLIKAKLLTEIKDGNGKVCGYNTSYISMKRNPKDYMLELNLSCQADVKNVIYYYSLDYNCLTCQGETYISPSEDDNNDTNNNTENNDVPSTPTLICKDYGAWTFEYKNDPSLEYETRTVVLGYKDNYIYGNWSEASEIPVTANEGLEVIATEGVKTVLKLSDWSKKSTTKPAAKEGRNIKSYDETISYYVTETKTETYTVHRKTWDNNAIKCIAKKIGDITCTYSRKVEEKVKKYKTVTYYQYQDTTKELVPTTYYTSRTITKGIPSYTGYILESEMPNGYQKVADSEKTQYRYREKCITK